MGVQVIKAGVFDTIQDAGRFGHQHLGINPCGAMDQVAMGIANMLAGNLRDAAVIELHYPASSFFFHEDCIAALSGADFCAMINDELVPVNTSILISKDSTLRFTHFKKGERCYMAIHGGWKVEKWLNSSSTHLKASLGGYEGRALKKDDVLSINPPRLSFPKPAAKSFVITGVRASVDGLYNDNKIIRCIKGSEYCRLSSDAKKIFETNPFKITVHSDRMGYCLNGENLSYENESLLSSAVARGTIQLLPSGQLIILMADHQTTGGYPKVAHVISADIATLAQMKPHENIHFQFISLKEAEDLYIRQQQGLQQLEDEISLQLNNFFNNGNY
jgi:antagonist of KipI